MSVIPRRLKFMAKYGTSKHKAELSAHVDHMMDRADQKGLGTIYWGLATDSDLPLTDHQIHRIIDSSHPENTNHPMTMLARWNFGNLKDEHWDKIARIGSDRDVMGVLAHMPEKHLLTVAKDQRREAFVRATAGSQWNYRNQARQELE